MKQIILSAAVAIVILLTAAAMANPTIDKKTPPPTKNTINLKIISPTPGTIWHFSAKQVVHWSISGLPSGNYNIVAFLKNFKDGKKGYIVNTLVSDGTNQANYVVNEIVYADGTYALTNGKYKFFLAVYKKPGTNQEGLGDLILEKDGGIIKIKGSDVPAGKQRKYSEINHY